MKKLNFIVLGTLLVISLATQAFADTTIPWTKEGCESVKGTWVTAHSPDDDGCDAAHCNGFNFCRSNVGMNWWSALIWCKSIGRELASIEDACPNSISTLTCANLKGRMIREWTTTFDTKGGICLVHNDRMYIGLDSPIGPYSEHALCK